MVGTSNDPDLPGAVIDRSPPVGFNLFVLQIISGKDSSEALRATLQIAANPALARPGSTKQGVQALGLTGSSSCFDQDAHAREN